MNAITKFFTGNKLSKLKSSAEFEAAVAELQEKLRDAIDQRDELDHSRKAALFGEGGDIAAVRKQIIEADGQIEDLTLALEGCRERHAEALKREKAEAIEARMAEAQKDGKRLRAVLKDWHKTASTLATLAAEIQELESRIKSANAEANAAARRDLAVPSVYAELAERQRDHINAKRADLGRPPLNEDRHRAITSPLAHLNLPGYWEQPSMPGERQINPRSRRRAVRAALNGEVPHVDPEPLPLRIGREHRPRFCGLRGFAQPTRSARCLARCPVAEQGPQPD